MWGKRACAFARAISFAVFLIGLCIGGPSRPLWARSDVPADGPPEPSLAYAEFCGKHARICESFSDDRREVFRKLVELIRFEVFLNFEGMDFYASAFAGDAEIYRFFSKLIQALEAAAWTDEVIADWTRWIFNNTLAFGALEEDARSAALTEYFLGLTELEPEDWSQIHSFVWVSDWSDHARAERHEFFQALAQDVAAAHPGALGTQLKVIRELERKSGKWNSFLTDLHRDEIESLAASSGFDEGMEAWGNAYVEFLSRSHDLQAPFLEKEPSESGFEERDVRKLGLGVFYVGQEQDIGKLARLVFKPLLGRLIQLEGEIVAVHQHRMVVRHKGADYAFDADHGRFRSLYVKKTRPSADSSALCSASLVEP